MWKSSNYNVITNYDVNYTVIHNLIKHDGVLIDNSDVVLIENILNKPNEYVEEFFFKDLCKKGILINEEYNEIDKIIEIKNQSIKEKENVLSLTIIPTYQCNFKCVYCWENTKNINDNMSDLQQKKLLAFLENNISKFSSLDIDWFGGEPLLAYGVIRNLLPKIDEICKKSKRPYSCSITTNGYLLTPEKFKFLLKYHTRFFQITVDGDKSLHDRNRPLKSGKGTYDCIISNLSAIRDEVSKGFFNFLIRLNVTEETAQCCADFLNMIKLEFSNDNRFSLYIQGVEEHNHIKHEEMKNKYLVNHGITEILYDCAIDKGIKITSLKMLKPADLMCKSVHNNNYFINSKGEIYKCDMNMNRENESFLGDLDSFTSVYELHNKCKKWKEYEIVSQYCKECILLPLCCGLRCPYYNSYLNKEKCELYNNYPLIKNAIKAYAQQKKYKKLKVR